MADKKVQIRFRNAQNEFDNIYPKTKIDLVEGLQAVLDNKVDKVSEIANSKSKVFVGTTQPTDSDIWFEIL